MIKTAITEMFNIKYPIICGAMMWLSKPELCAAISNAGGMGNITAGNYETEDDFRNAIRKVRELTDKPFVIGLTLLPSIRITAEHHSMYAKVCAEEKVPALEISGSPLDKVVGRQGVDMLKNAGVRLFHKVGSVRHAVHAQKAGYDGVYPLEFVVAEDAAQVGMVAELHAEQVVDLALGPLGRFVERDKRLDRLALLEIDPDHHPLPPRNRAQQVVDLEPAVAFGIVDADHIGQHLTFLPLLEIPHHPEKIFLADADGLVAVLAVGGQDGVAELRIQAVE